jgi:hypothetical protein
VQKGWTPEVFVIRALAFLAVLAPAAAFAQSEGSGMPGMHHDHMMMTPAQGAAMPREGGQSAFAAIKEIVDLLEADPKTDWAKVDIEALRQHLIDMNNVTLSAEVKSEAIEGGVRFVATGSGAVADSIRRMTLAHAAMMNGVAGWKLQAQTVDGGAALTVKAPANDLIKVRALGYIGILTLGMRHQMHHLMIARGQDLDP